ncbi:MAG TPA: DUF3108 domain-containing protein [Gemmatimonadaceae bacterium]|nr:DUF3108 domain-containing protein [Gemmatimonadaceae bacterium]
MSALHSVSVQRALALAFAAAAAIAPARASAQATMLSAAPPVAPVAAWAAVPYGVGEELTYKATFGGIPAGTARMRVDGIVTVRGRPAYHVVFTIDGGVPFFRVHDRYESWIDVQTLASLRHRQEIREGRYKRTTVYEIYPERGTYEEGDSVYASVAHPLDDGSFIYAVRTAGIRVGETRRDDRYFRPDRNPVVLTGLRREAVRVGAGTFATTVVRPSIKANGIFSENGEAQVWFSEDARRYPVLVKSKFAKFSLTLALQSVVTGELPITATATTGK